MILANVVGNLGKDSEIRSLDTGSVTNFSIASTDYNRKTNRKDTTWIDCSMWGKRGESLSPYLKKGQKVSVSGRLTIDSYTSNKDGEVRFSTKINVDQIELCGGVKSEGYKDDDLPLPDDWN